MPRHFSNWLEALLEFVEETESPRDFWIWSGIFMISSALERKVWLPFGLETIYPNLYILLVAPPGKCRKGPPISLARKFLAEIEIPIFADSPTKRAMTKQMVVNEKDRFFKLSEDTEAIHTSSIVLISKELSSFLAIDSKNMIEILTDLWDSHDDWKYTTAEKGEDWMHNIYVTAFLASTPSWISANLPPESIGGGFTSRVIIVSARKKYKLVPRPPIPDEEMRKKLIEDLKYISSIKGEFTFTPEADEFYNAWYITMEEKKKRIHDERLHSFVERLHAMAIKTAMILHLSYADDLVLTLDDIKRGIVLNEKILDNASTAFGGHGRSFLSVDTDRVMNQLRDAGHLSVPELLTINWRNCPQQVLEQILSDLQTMGFVEIKSEGSERIVYFKDKRGKL